MAVDMKNFQFAVPMQADSKASSYPGYVQLAFPNGTMFVFETFAATPEDWTVLFSLVDATSFLQSNVFAYTALDAHYPLLLFLAFGHYSFVPEVYNAPALFPHDSLDATEIDHLTETIIPTFHNVALSEVLPANSADRVYPTISQIALPYKFFMFHCTSSDHGWSFCLGTVPNSFRSIKVLTRTTHAKLLTAPKVPKKKK
uniref:Uncharacterized protein n=1 Tax=Romanomermis culicivorax TaxID=13658 RepID=A0A915J865_ROMCU